MTNATMTAESISNIGFECEIYGGLMAIHPDAEYLDFFVDNVDEDGDPAPVSIGVHQAMHLRDLLNKFLALPVNAAAVKELEGAL